MSRSRRSAPAISISRRRLLALSGATAAVGLVAACTSDPMGGGADLADLDGAREGAMDDFDADVPFVATSPIELEMLFCDWPEYSLRPSWTFWDEVAERTNVSITPLPVPLSDFLEKRALLVSAGDAPVLMPLTYAGEEVNFVAGGAILPVSDYLDLMPNFRKHVEAWDLQADVDRLRQEDGKFYLIPGLQEVPNPDFTIVVRTDVFEAEGLEIPDTWDELREALVVLKQRYPDVYPFSDRFQGNSSLNYAAVAHGTSAGWGYGSGAYYREETDAFEYTGAMPEYRALVEMFAGLIADGLMDPESYTQELVQHDQKVATSQCFVMTGNSGDIVTWTNGLNETLGEGTFGLAKIPPPAGPAGPRISGGRLWHGVMVSAAARERPDFVAIMQFVDWLFFDTAAKEFCKWGIEGETFERTADGGRALIGDYALPTKNLNPTGTVDLLADLGFSHNVFSDGNTADLMQSMLGNREQGVERHTLEVRELAPPAPPAPLSELEREQVSLQTTPLKDTVDSNTLQFILGQRDLAEWDDYVAELRAQGSDDYVATVQTAYERYRDR